LLLLRYERKTYVRKTWKRKRKKIRSNKLLLKNSPILLLKIGKFIELWKNSRPKIIKHIFKILQEMGQKNIIFIL
jgi:hypothetical protein